MQLTSIYSFFTEYKNFQRDIKKKKKKFVVIV